MSLKTNTSMNRRGGAGCSAFTLIEVMMAAGLVGFIFFTLYAGFTFGFAVVQLNRENVRATQLLQEKMELVRLYTWNEMTNTGYMPTNFTEAFYPGAGTNTGPVFTGTVTVASAPITETYTSDMRMV